MQQYLTVIKKIDLKQLVAQPEHNSMSGLEPLLDIDKFLLSLEFQLLLRHLLHLLVQMYDESLEKEILLLKISVFGHRICLVAEDVLLLKGGVLDEVDVSRLMDGYCLA